MTADEPTIAKIVVTGAFGSGKTQFVRTLNTLDTVDPLPPPAPGQIIAMDFGRLHIADDLTLYAFSTPGGRRFDFMWEILAEGLLGVVVLVDSSAPPTFRESRKVIHTMTGHMPVPYVVAASFQDHPDAVPPDDLQILLRVYDVPVVPCVATDPESVKNVLLALLENALVLSG
jgi:signal recognition particle receptor subunit beta